MNDDDAYKVKVESARFELAKIKMNLTVLNDHSMALLKSNARYPIRRSEIKTFSIPKGNMQTVKESLFSGQLPRRLVIGLLISQALTGLLFKKNIQRSTLQPLLFMRPCGW